MHACKTLAGSGRILLQTAWQAQAESTADCMALTSNRADVQRYQGQVREVARHDYGDVVDRDNKRYPAKLVLPVNIDSEQLAAGDEEDPRDPRRTAQARPILQRFVDPALGFIGRRTGFPQIGGFLNRQPGFKEAALRANIKGNTIKKFLDMFPEHFRLDIRPGGGYVYPREEPAVRRRIRGKQPGR